MCVCVCITESLHCTPEINTMLQINYTPMKKILFERQILFKP